MNLDEFGQSAKLPRYWNLSQCPKSIYIAASMNNESEARRLALELSSHGFNITSRWLMMDFADRPSRSDSGEPWRKFALFEKSMGVVDFQDVTEADTLIVLSDVESSSGGFHVEFGCFLGARKDNIVVIGQRSNVFYYNDSVRYFPTMYKSKVVSWIVEQRKLLYGN